MKNKKILLILFYLVFIFLPSRVFSNEIYFETPELQSFDNGNILKAPKRGKVLTNNNIEILADEFEYNKTTTLLSATNNVIVIDSLNNVTMRAEKLFYLKDQNKIFTKDKTEIVIDKIYIINSSDVVFLRNEMLIYSEKNTTLEDNIENFYTAENFKYFIDNKVLKTSKVNLLTKEKDYYFLNNGMINLLSNEIQGKDLEVEFNKHMFGNPLNEPRLKGNTAYSNEKETIVSKGAFTTCKKRNGKCPPWVIEAKEVKHDKIKKIIHYKNAWLKVYDVPVLYYPRFFHPDPTVKRQSGFLKPQLGDSENLGSSAYIPYFKVISDSQDMTIKPRIFGDNKYVLQSEYRQVTKNTKNIFDLSLTRGHDSTLNDKGDSRSHFFSNSKIDLNLEDYENSSMEVQLQKTSNDTYLKVFNLESPLLQDISTLNSFVNLKLSNENLDFSTSFEVYEKFDSANSDRYEFILPNFALTKIIENNKSQNGTLTFDTSGSQNIYDTNIVETSIINNLSYQSDDKILNSGIKNNYNILLKNVNTDGKNSTKYKDSFGSEIVSSFLFNSSYPLISEGQTFDDYFIPQISMRYSPNNMKNLSSSARRIGISNIWALNRIGASDTIESGQSLTVGAEYKKIKKKQNKDKNKISSTDFLKLELATVFRDEVNSNLPKSSTIGNKSSDIVGSLNIRPNNILNLDYNFSADNSLDHLKYNELSANFNVNNFITNFKYLEENDGIGSEKYIQNNTSFKINKNSSLYFSTRKNKKIDLTEFYDLVYRYKNDCLTAALHYKKDFYANNDIKPSQQLFFSLTIVPLGAYETKNIIQK